jgi:uncharacterized membrane protein YdjX (TVP38/TMEM64 family)
MQAKNHVGAGQTTGLRRHLAVVFGFSRRAAVLVAVVAVAGLLALSEELHGQLVASLALADPLFARHTVTGALLFVGFAALSAILVFFSSVLLVPVGVRTWGATGCFLLLWCGWFLGGLVTYTIGRHLGRPVVRRMLSDDKFARYERFIPHSGSFLTATLVQLALPSDVSGYFFGLLGYQARVYLGALVCAELPYALGTVFLGSAFIRREYGLLLSASAVAIAVLVLLRQHRRRQTRLSA